MCIRFRSLVCALGLLAFLATVSGAQNNADRISRIQASLNNAKQTYDQLPDQVKKTARAQRRLAHLADAVNRMAGHLGKVTPGQQWSNDRTLIDAQDKNSLVKENNPARDF